MMDRREKLQLIANIYQDNACNFSRSLLKLIDGLIDEARALNDEALPSEVVRNQGKITTLKDLKDYILKGLPEKDDSKGLNLT
jgi:hypothetical protein